MSELLKLASSLIERASVTPRDDGCQALIGERLGQLGFRLEAMSRGEVTNLWARRGEQDPVLCFAGHTDVVPPGPREHWATEPFSPELVDGDLVGRGAADMKGSLAAMLIALERFLASHPDHRGSLAMLLTSDEEGPAIDGTRAVMDTLAARNEHMTFCIIGEPSARERSGDRVRIGRRGSLNVRLTVRGVQGHVAYPEEALNPIHRALPALEAIASHTWDTGTDKFAPTSLQFTDLHAGAGASNVTPGDLTAHCNLRFAPASDARAIEETLRRILSEHQLDFELSCTLSGEPFYTPPGELTRSVRAAIEQVCQFSPEESTGGGTSDGRFIAPRGVEVVELGPPGRTLHQVNERVSIAELERLAEIYLELMRRLLA